MLRCWNWPSPPRLPSSPVGERRVWLSVNHLPSWSGTFDPQQEESHDKGNSAHCCRYWPVAMSSPVVLRHGWMSNTDLGRWWPDCLSAMQPSVNSTHLINHLLITQANCWGDAINTVVTPGWVVCVCAWLCVSVCVSVCTYCKSINSGPQTIYTGLSREAGFAIDFTARVLCSFWGGVVLKTKKHFQPPSFLPSPEVTSPWWVIC